jgi:uncharacterized protein YbjT (DUF2867 family)
MNILVVGATGVLGQETLRCLAADGYRARAMTRSPERGEALARLGAEVVIGDLVDRRSLARACQGIDRVFAAAHSAMGRGKYRSEAVDDLGHRALIDAARSAGVTRFVYTSALGAAIDHPVDFFRTKFTIEEYLQRSGLEHVILRPSAFMEWHAHTFNGKAILASGRTTLLGSGTKLRNFVAARDVARIAVRALTFAEVRQGVVEIAGPGNFTNNEVAHLYARTAGIEPRVGHVPASVLKVAGWIVGPLHPGIGRIMRISSLPDDAYPESFDVTIPSGERSSQPTTLQEFVRERVAEAGISVRR